MASLHPAVERALRIAGARGGPEAAEADAALRVLLEQQSTAPAGFTGSALSMEEFPVEMAFSTADSALRYTVDPAPPGSDPRGRVDAAKALMTRLGAPALPARVLKAVRRLQDRRSLRFGAFIGGRHGAGDSRYKLYLEVPEEAAVAEAEQLAAKLIGRPGALPDRKQRIEMIGVDPAGGRVEIYARIENMIAPEIVTLLWRADLMARQSELLALLSECCPFPIWRELPGTVFGFSYSVSERGGPTIFTLYTHARTLFGSDGKTRARILELGRQKGWDLGFYEHLTEPLAARDGVTTSHTMFGITVSPEAPLGVTFGVVPPSVGPSEETP